MPERIGGFGGPMGPGDDSKPRATWWVWLEIDGVWARVDLSWTSPDQAKAAAAQRRKLQPTLRWGYGQTADAITIVEPES